MGTQANTKFKTLKDVKQGIFRTYDIRGIVGEGVDDNAFYTIAKAFAVKALELKQHTVILGRDARVSSPALVEALRAGLMQSGINIIDIGIVPTPLLYFATKVMPQHTGMMLTASHNPAEYNGLKIVLDGKTLSSDEIADIYQRVQAQTFKQGQGGITYYEHIVDDYINDVCQRIQLKKALKIVIDCGNGVAALVAPQLFKRLGCEVIELFCEVDGRFPNHHPDPTVEANLVDLQNAVRKHHADCGLAFDGDADRLGVVDNKANIIWPDRLTMLFSKDMLQRHPGSKIIFDVKCSKHLPEVIKQNGGEPMMWRTGHSVLKAKMLAENAAMAGELSGHIFFNRDWYGFDDGVFVGAKLLNIIAAQEVTLEQLMQQFPDSVNTPELKIKIAEDKKQSFMQQLLANAKFDHANIVTMDGFRVEFEFGWGLVRVSNTTPALTVRFEAQDVASLEKVKTIFRDLINSVDASLEIPF